MKAKRPCSTKQSRHKPSGLSDHPGTVSADLPTPASPPHTRTSQLGAIDNSSLTSLLPCSCVAVFLVPVRGTKALDVMPQGLKEPEQSNPRPPRSKGRPQQEEGELVYVTTKQVAKIMGVHKETLRRYVNDGRFPNPDIKGRIGQTDKWRVTTVARYAEDQEKETANKLQ